jgi:hypothetical protein
MLDRMKNSAEAVYAQMALLDRVPDWQKIAESIKAVPPLIDAVGEATVGVPPMLKKRGAEAAQSWGDGFESIAKNFGSLMTDAIVNGDWRNAIAAMGSQVGELIGSQVGKSLGKAIGGTFGSVLSAVMPGVGSLLGPVIDKFWGWATKSEGRKVNDLRDAFISAAGGLAALNAKAAAAGTTLNALLRASTVKDYEAAVAALNAKLERTAQLQGELAGLQQQLADRQVMDWQRAQELIEKYGGTLGNLGQAFTDAKTAANWKSIWDDWQTLIDMGADVGGVLVSMKDEISALVQESIRVGTEIPAQFKPLIEELIRTGQLLDANGEAITDIGQLKFGAPLVSEVDKIIAKIDELIQALTTGLVGAFESVGRVRLPTVKIPYEFEATNELPEGGRPTPSFASGSGGFRNFGAGTLAMLHGYEAVVPRGEAVTSGRPIELTLTLTSTTNLDGKEVARNQVRYLPNQLALAGV